MLKLEDYIERDAGLYPDKDAIVCDQERCSYGVLQQRITERADELLREGYQKGQIVCLRALPSIDYLVTYFALHVIDCVVAPLEKDLPETTFNRISHSLTSFSSYQHSSFLIPHSSLNSSSPADILYTTGTTGSSKGVIISHRAILADAENLIDGQGFSHELAFVVNGPLNHIGSLSKIWPVMMLGSTLIIVDGMKDIASFFRAFDYPAIKMATFLVPASIRILIQLGSSQLAALADRIDFIETGAAAISQADMEALCRLLPKSRLYNTYASTETGIISTYDFNDGRCIAGCLGRPMKHSQVMITENGTIACKGATIMSGYVGDPERTALILRDDTIYTSDIGEMDEYGMLHLKGREDDVINVGGFKVSPTEVEDAALSFPQVRDCVCVAANHLITGKALKLLVVMCNGQILDKRALALHLKSKLETYKIPLLYEQIDTVQRTFNGKIDRKYYKLIMDSQ